jgi:hypothetical protein
MGEVVQKELDQLLCEYPNLKAREIAKRLGRPRNEISAFLHDHKDHYHQNASYQWSLKKNRQRTISIYSGWVTSEQLEQNFQEAGALLEMDCDTVEIIFPQNCKPMIDALARILALMNQLPDQSRTVTADFTNCQDTWSYLDRAGFFDLLDSRVKVLPQRPLTSAAQIYKGNSDALVEFRQVNPQDDNEEIKKQLTQTFVRLSSDDYVTAAYTVFGELIDNIKEHSRTPIFGFAGLQRYRGLKEHIQIVVSDSGLGIANTLRTSLKELHPDLYKKYSELTPKSDADLVLEVMSKGGVSRFGEGRGLGFKSSREQATKFNAQFTVRQDRYSLQFEFKEGSLTNVIHKPDLCFLAGTHICFDFQVD